MTVLLKPIDILDAAIEDCLSHIHRQSEFFYYERHTPTPASVVYTLHYHHMGSVKLVKRTDSTTEFIFIDPPKNRFDLMTAEQLAEELFIYNQQDGPSKQYKTEEERQKTITFYAKTIEERREMIGKYEEAKAYLVQMLKDTGLWIEGV